jgi:hypothetical protein
MREDRTPLAPLGRCLETHFQAAYVAGETPDWEFVAVVGQHAPGAS